MSEEEIVECGTHGVCRGTLLCGHLVTGERLGFHCGYRSKGPDDPYPDAWCDACAKVIAAEGEWTEEVAKFVALKVLCSFCYGEIRARNWIQDEDAYDELLQASCRYIQQKQAHFLEEFRINHAQWNWDQNTGKLLFSHDGVPQVEADVDFVGSLSTLNNTWRWAWANPTFVEGAKSASREIRSIGEQQGFLRLAAGEWEATQVDGWDNTAIMAKVLGAIGAYRTPGDNGYTFMVVRDARWVSKKPALGKRFKDFMGWGGE